MVWKGLAIVSLVLATSCAGWAISICDYRSPHTALTEIEMLLSYRYFDDGGTPDVDINSGHVTIDLDAYMDSPDFGSSLASQVDFTLTDSVPTNLLAQATGALRYYMAPESQWFAFGGAEGSAALDQTSLDVRGGGGFGRFTDVTPLAKAIRVGEMLVDLGLTDDQLSDPLLESVAEIIDRHEEYPTVIELIGEIEETIEAETQVDLGSESFFWMEDIIERTDDTRMCGWAVQAGLGFGLIDTVSEPQNVLLTISGDLAWTSSPREQLVIHGGFSGPITQLDGGRVSATAEYDLALREDIEFDGRFTWQRVHSAQGDPVSRWRLSGAISYDMEGADVGIQVSFGRDSEDPRPTLELSVSALIAVR